MRSASERAILDGLVRALADRDHWKQFGARGRGRVLANYTTGMQAARYLSLLDEITSARQELK
jgi:hypothetical protein